MNWSHWFRQTRAAAPIRAHRLRPAAPSSAGQILESRLYLGALPGVEGAIWTDESPTHAAEPAIVELLEQPAEPDTNAIELAAWQTMLETTSPDPVGDAGTSVAPTTPQSSSPTASTPSILGEPVVEVLVTAALSDPDQTSSDGTATAPTAMAVGNDLPVATSSGSVVDPVLEVADPLEGTAGNGTVPFGAGAAFGTSSRASSAEALPIGFTGVSASRLVTNAEDPLVIKYDYRDAGGFANELTTEQLAAVEQAMADWTTVLHGAIRFERDTTAPDHEILNLGIGDLALYHIESGVDGTLGLGGGSLRYADDGTPILQGTIWLDHAETWDHQLGNGEVPGTYDLYSVMTHEIGHALGLEDAPRSDDGIMNGAYRGERSILDLYNSVAAAGLLDAQPWASPEGYTQDVSAMMADPDQLSALEVQERLALASAVTGSNDAIIAIVDRNGRILGVRVEQEVLDTFAGRPDELVFAIDGAVAKARTAAFFANGDPENVDEFSPNGTATPLTSRLVRFISQSTITEREVGSNPNIPDLDSAERGPGFVAPVGLGGHFPPDVSHTPPVDLFRIEHTNRDSVTNAGANMIREGGGGDDFELRTEIQDGREVGRFNLDPDFVPDGQGLFAPESYGVISGMLPSAQSRGIATLPGGIPLFRDTDGDQLGDKLIGGVGVFFPGQDGTALFEQGFVAGEGQSTAARTNAPKVLEAEFIAVVTAGGSLGAERLGADGAKPAALLGTDIDIPFGRIDLVGIQLEVIGPTPGIQGVIDLVDYGEAITDGQAGTFAASGVDMPINTMGELYTDGLPVPEGWLVEPHDSTDGSLTAADVERIVMQSIAAAEETRSAIRLTADTARPGSRARMVIAVADTNGEILGLYRMKDSTVFSIDVAVAKARNTAYYADAGALQPEDQVPGIDPGTAFTNRTFRFLAEPRFPSGVDGSTPPEFSILNAPGIDPLTAENTGAPLPASDYNDTVVGYDAFHTMTNFRDPGDAGVVAAGGALQPKANQNGIVFFPGSTPVYLNDGSTLAGGFGISGDGVDQDDVVTVLGAQGYLPDGEDVIRADQTFVDGVRLPYTKFLRNPFG
jgi:uncharacterized protein GlcG (DUF336 family)